MHNQHQLGTREAELAAALTFISSKQLKRKRSVITREKKLLSSRRETHKGVFGVFLLRGFLIVGTPWIYTGRFDCNTSICTSEGRTLHIRHSC